MQFRKDIQVLRGISVLLVVLFHLELGRISSGFLGVDIFFVISGFLMAILYDKNKKSEFFLKRAKRLLPAYFVTIIFIVVVAVLHTTPNEFNSVVKQSIFATLFSSNIGYWLENSYFNKSAFNPLLHLWSLGVEIQFYFLVPLFFWAYSRSKFLLPIFLVLSLISCFFFLIISPKTSFFMMPLRLWEFLIGYSVAIYFTNKGVVKKTGMAWLGATALIILIGIPAMNVDGQALSFINGHPGVYALVVSLATGTILAFGIPGFIENSKLGSFLETAGKYSYSIYLVHFPVLVLYLYQPFSGTILKTNSLTETFWLVTVILFLSILMYHYVEVPFRKSQKPRQWMLALPSIVLVVASGGFFVQQLKFSDNEMLIFNAWSDRNTFRCDKIYRILEPTAVSCDITNNIEAPTQRILLVGNSHASTIKSTFSSVAKSMNVDVRFLVPNNPLMRGGMGPGRIVKEAISTKSNAIVLHYSPNAVDISTIIKLVDLAEKNEISVAFIMPVPVWDRHIPKALWRHAKFNEELPRQSLEDYEKKNNQFYSELLNINHENFRVYPVGHYFCNKDCRITDSSGKPFYFDTWHLTLTGSELLRSLFKKIITDDQTLGFNKPKI